MNILDTRNLQERLDELEDLLLDDDGLDEDDREELEQLQEMRGQISEWKYGVTLIDEDDFVDYCRELVKEIGDLPADLPWYIESAIDWNKVAEALQSDYDSVEYQGTTYLFRC